MKKITAIILFFCFTASIYPQDFPVLGNVRTRVDFWKKVYTEISTTEAFLHDSENLALIFKKVSLPPRGRRRNSFLKKERGSLRAMIRSMAKKKEGQYSKSEKEIFQKIKKAYGDKARSSLRSIARHLRFQYGLRDRYYQGLLRSQKYLFYIKSVLKKEGLPLELAYLPHVESSFNYQAYSKVGAAGIWQFMRSTARLYKLKVSYAVDERRDVIKATRAAANFLKDNYRQLKTWPLALTAYNHGAASVKRAVRKLGTRRIHEIIERYKGRRFGFASKNFYSTFMATVEISKNPEKYFTSFKPIDPISFSEIILPKKLNIKQIKEATGLSSEDIKEYNPSIRASVFRSSISLPRRFKLHLPKTDSSLISSWKNKMKAIKRRVPKPGEAITHTISRGESLFDIARLYGVTVSSLAEDNEIPNPSRIFPGMRLKVYRGIKKVAILEKTTPLPSPAAAQIKKPSTTTAKTPTSLPLQKSDTTDIAQKELNLDLYSLDLDKKKNGFYSVQIEVEETLGHFAEWAQVRSSDIRKWNRLSYGKPIYLGKKIRIKIKSVSNFEKLSREYHLSLQEDFYESFMVNGKTTYSVKKGDTITSILNKFELPLWLLRSAQEGKKFSSSLQIGHKIQIPTIEQTQSSAAEPFSDSENQQ